MDFMESDLSEVFWYHLIQHGLEAEKHRVEG